MRAGLEGLVRGGGLIAGGVALVVVLLLLFGNGSAGPLPESGDALTCRLQMGGELPAEVHETSGLTRGIDNPGLFWTHNDSGGDPVLFALGGDGALVGAVRVEGASLRDWEDIEAAPCRSRDAACLYIADTGDNEGERDHVTIYEVREPGPGEAAVAARPLRVRYPGGPRDAEGLFAVDGTLYVVTKGREGPIRVYRVPGGAGADGVATLERVAEVAPRPAGTGDYVTAATATPDGRWVAIRSYRTLLLIPAAPMLAGSPRGILRFDLQPLGEAQGEGLAMDDEGGVWLTSEARGGAPPRWNRLACELPDPPSRP